MLMVWHLSAQQAFGQRMGNILVLHPLANVLYQLVIIWVFIVYRSLFIIHL